MRSRLLGWRDVALFAALTVLPLVLGGRGRLNADTKQYLYLDPGGLLAEARHLWNPHIGGGTVTHQYVGYLWPMGPYYWVAETVGLPDWVAQRIWIGGIQMIAGLGALALFRYLLPRHPAHVVAAIVYGLSPFVLGHVVGQSGLLLPFAALGWLVLFAARSVDEGGWRWPAAFALVVTTCGSLNGSSIFWVVLGASGWVLWAAVGPAGVGARRGLAALGRMAALTLPAQLWWLTSYLVSGAYGLDLLAVTETVETTNATTSAAEIVRGLGYWFFYGRDNLGPWLPELAVPYTRSTLVVITFVVPVAAVASAAFLRWRHRGYFVGLLVTGTVLSVGAFPSPGSPLGTIFESLSRSNGLVLSLRNTQRAAPLVVLGLAGLVAAAGTALQRRHARSGAVALGVVLLAALGSIPGQWRSGLIGAQFHREEIPQAWRDAADLLDDGSGRVLELPGIDFASHRWGHTLDPILPGLTSREVLSRDLAPAGGPAGMSLLAALDRGVQEGTLDPTTLVPVLRLLGIADLVVRSDLEYERYRTARPEAVWDMVTDPATGLRGPVEFGDRSPNRARDDRPMIDEARLVTGWDAEVPPQVAVFSVPGGGRERLTTAPVDGNVIVEGDGDGLVAAAAAGLVDGSRPVLLAADILAEGDPPGTDHLLVVTDTFRKAAQRWYSLRENTGATEPLEGDLVDADPSDARLSAVPDAPDGHRTVVRWTGAEAIWANAYGNRITLLPDERPSNAFDGNADTSWRVDTASVPGRPHIGIRLDRDVTTDHIVLHPSRRIGSRNITGVEVVLDGTRTVTVPVDGRAATDPGGIRVDLDRQPFREVEITITGWEPDDGPVGFAQVVIPGIEVEELVELPRSALRWHADSADGALAIVLTRRRTDPAEVIRADEEPSLRRLFTLHRPEQVTVTGTARLHVNADDMVLAELLGLDPATWWARSSERLDGAVTTWATSAFDGDPTTAWSTPFVGITERTVQLDVGRELGLATLDLDVVVDRWHSTPRQVAVAFDDSEPVLVDLPDLEPGPLGTVRSVSVPLPRPLSGRVFALAVTEAEPRYTTDWYSQTPVALPVALAEVGLPGVTAPSLPVVFDTGCRDDLLEIDGAGVAIRIQATTADALAGRPLPVTACEPGPRELASGDHVVRTTDGRDTGIDLDQVVLANAGPAWRQAPAEPPATVHVRSVEADRVSGEIESDGRPFWLVLDQSVNDGWELRVDGATVHGPHVVHGYANGWVVEPDGAGTFAVSARWRPQLMFDGALAVSALAVIGCATLATWPRRRRRAPGHSGGAPTWAIGGLHSPGARRILTTAVALAVAAAVLVHPAAGPVAGLAVLVGLRWPVAARLAPAVLMSVGAAIVVVAQVGETHAIDRDWPQHFPLAHVAVYLAVIALAGTAVTETRDTGTTRTATGGDGGPGGERISWETEPPISTREAGPAPGVRGRPRRRPPPRRPGW